jgi:hypothetical protein
MLMDAVGSVVTSAKQTAPQINPLEVRFEHRVPLRQQILLPCIGMKSCHKQWQLRYFPNMQLHCEMIDAGTTLHAKAYQQ